MSRAQAETGAVFGPRMRYLAWVVCGVSAIGTVVAILVGSRFVAPEAGERDSYTDGPLGHRAFVEVMEELGVEVYQDRRGVYADVRAPLFIIEPNGTEVEVDGEARLLSDILAQRAQDDLVTVVVLPKWRLEGGTAAPDPLADEVLSAVLPDAELDHLGSEGAEMQAHQAVGTLGVYTVTLPWPQRIDTVSAPTLLDINGSALIVRRADGVVVIADPDLLHSWNIQRTDNAAVLHALITEELAAQNVSIDEVFHDHGLRLSLPMALGEWPAVLITAQVLLCILLIVLIGARRFGPPLVTRALGHGPAESIAVSAFVLSEGRPLGALTQAYVHELIVDLAAHLGLSPGKPLEAQAAHIDAVARRRGLPTEASTLLGQAREVAADRRRAKRDAMTIARTAAQLRQRFLQ